ncbi:MAG: hypothetical protein J6Y37_11675 [Paludibacteraceae bacterium]|nr:hypothetical protein [Paludibacteraceae bacterium]
MENIIDLISLFLVVAIVAYPFFALSYVEKHSKWVWLMMAIVVLNIFLSLAYCFFDDCSTNWLLSYYGYDFGGMGEEEIYRNVKDCDRERVESLLHHYMGVGWPLRAMFMYVMLTAFHLVASLVLRGIFKIRESRGNR